MVDVEVFVLKRTNLKSGILSFPQFTSLQKEIDDHKQEIKMYQGETTKLNNVIRNLEKDISGLKKEIQERDETIQDKVGIRYMLMCCSSQVVIKCLPGSGFLGVRMSEKVGTFNSVFSISV